MSRILEALQKARLQHTGEKLELPSVDEIINAGETPSTRLGSSDLAERLAMGRSLLSRCRVESWEPNQEKLLFLAGDSEPAGQEQFRSLRSRLYQMRGIAPLSVVAVSSALANDGKSFVSANLAHALALQEGRSVLLIDADLRRAGGLPDLLKSPPQLPGLTDFLSGRAGVEELLQKGPLPNLYMIPARKPVANAGELVGSPLFPQLIEMLRPIFDWIIIDTPPSAIIADAPLISGFCDGVLFVVNATATPVAMAKRAIKLFRKECLLGVVLNRSEEPTRSYYGYGSSGSGSAKKSKS